jgi:hypothetical protein
MFDPQHPGRSIPTPLDGPDLQVHPQRHKDGVSATERLLVLAFLRRYIVWQARRRDIARVRDAMGLLLELTGAPIR